MNDPLPEQNFQPGIYTIPAGTPFLEVLATGILKHMGERPESLSRITLLLPTRRACRALSEAFLRASGGKPLLLPRMTPLGDIDEDELSFGDVGGNLGGEDQLDLAPAIPGMKRQLLLTRLILTRKDIAASPEQAVILAQELAGLLDQVHTERLNFDDLANLVEGDNLSIYWQKTLDFLTIVTDNWPEILAAEGAIDPARRRNELLAAQTAAWIKNPPQGPVIAAGSTGSIPATADLLKVIADLPQGVLVLPGIDRDADGNVWQNLAPSHPQYGMAHLLGHLGIDRHQVADWPSLDGSSSGAARRQLMNLALRPAETTGVAPDQSVPEECTNGIIRINAATPQEEAKSIALIMRRTLETPERTAALVTPDRALARRVAEELLRWGVKVDDSAGRPLSETPPGTFIRLTANMVGDGLSPVSLLAALKHPLAAAGQTPASFRTWVRHLERLLLHGPRPGPGIAGLRNAITVESKKAEDRKLHERAAGLSSLVPGLDALGLILQPLCDLMAKKEVMVGDLLNAHVTCIEALAATDVTPGMTTGPERLWRGEDGEAAATFIAELADTSGVLGGAIAPRHYPALLDTLMASRMVRPRYGQHARLHIWGNLEARLQSADVMILGGLNEATWPPEAKPSPWMSRPMARDFGLPLPERRIGLSAHDFAQAACAPNVVLTRAERVGGTPTVASRWLQRLDNILAGAGLTDGLMPQDDWLGWADGLDQPSGRPKSVVPPRPCPPLAARPRKLPVTRIRTLVRDPYALYAERILKLKPLEAIDADPDARHKGIVIHEVLDRFTRQYPDDLPADAEQRLIEMGRDAFDELMAWPTVRALWWPRFERIASWFVSWEQKRRDNGIRVLKTEIDGTLKLDLPGGPFELTARADRIDRLADGNLSIIDYKTGAVSSGRQMESGLEPQLPLEGAIAENNGYFDVGDATVTELMYVQVSGGREPGKEKRPQLKNDIDQLINDNLEGLQRLLGRYDMPDMPYRSRQRFQFEQQDGNYDHLARFKEWGLGSGDDE